MPYFSEIPKSDHKNLLANIIAIHRIAKDRFHRYLLNDIIEFNGLQRNIEMTSRIRRTQEVRRQTRYNRSSCEANQVSFHKIYFVLSPHFIPTVRSLISLCAASHYSNKTVRWMFKFSCNLNFVRSFSSECVLLSFSGIFFIQFFRAYVCVNRFPYKIKWHSARQSLSCKWMRSQHPMDLPAASSQLMAFAKRFIIIFVLMKNERDSDEKYEMICA